MERPPYRDTDLLFEDEQLCDDLPLLTGEPAHDAAGLP